MRLKEQRLWDRTRDNLSALPAPRIRLERYENVVAEGCPDVLALCDGLVTWVELKAVHKAPARNTTRLMPVGEGLSVEQRNWHLDWHQNRGRSLVLIGVGSSIIIALPGKLADSINSMTFAEAASQAVALTWGELAIQLGRRPF
jgi:hypothetical protein